MSLPRAGRFAVLLLAVGCGGGRGASIEGDVFLVMKSGDTKKGAGLTVYLLPDSTSARARLGDECATQKATIKAVSDSTDVANAALDRRSDEAHEVYLKDILNERKGDAYRAASSALIFGLRRSVDRTTEVHNVAVEAVRRVIHSMATDSTGTGVNAHYRFAGVNPGKYLLFSEWTIGPNEYQWLVPATVAKGDSLVLDLDTAREANDQVYCGIK